MNNDSIMSGLVNLLKSRRFLSAVISLILALLVNYFPDLAFVKTELFVLIGTVATVLVMGYSVEDAVIASKQAPMPNTSDLQKLVLEVVEALLQPTTEVEAQNVPLNLKSKEDKSRD